jgi:transposase-like protein
MSHPVNSSKDTLPKQWQYVKRNLQEMGIINQTEADDMEARAKLVVEGFFQRSINGEFKEQIKAEEYEWTDERSDIRSGTYPRIFTTTFGKTKLLIPKVRKKSQDYIYKLFSKYQRRQKRFDDMIVLSLLLGFSTRKQQKFFQAFIGDSVSHQRASELLQSLGNDLRAYQTKPIEDKYRFLILDGLWVHIQELDIKKRPVLFALGITKDGRQEVIAFKLAKGETEEEYTAFLNDLYRKGLMGKSLELIISDGSEAIRRFRFFVNRWHNLEPKAVKCFQDEFYHTLNFSDFPKEVRSAISTTNHLERFLEEIRRRIKIQGYFKNERSLNLWIFGLIKHIKLNPIQQPKGYASK